MPRIVVIENVLGLRTSGLPRVLADLAALGFDAEWADLAASDIGAPHQRRRMFIVATHSERVNVRLEPGWLERACRKAAAEHRYDPSRGIAATANGMRRLEQARRIATDRGWARHAGWELGDIARMDDGFPAWVDVGRARKALGNAVVPACAEVIGRAIMEATG